MQVITTHLNADFDCLASMVAAKKLYPEAKMVFSGSAEKMVHRYLKKMTSVFEISRIKEIDLDKVSLLVLVDKFRQGQKIFRGGGGGHQGMRVLVNSQCHQGAFFAVQGDAVFRENFHHDRGRRAAFFYYRFRRLKAIVRFRMMIVNMNFHIRFID